MRPIGGVLFGQIGDRLGRARALQLSIFVMAVPTTLIAFLPTHAQVGVLAPALLLVLRLAQGLSVGGEFIGSCCYLVEVAPAGRRGLFGSWSVFGTIGGMLLGSAVATLMHELLSSEQIHTWGCRLPFLGGVLVGVVGWRMRRGVQETPEFARLQGAGRIEGAWSRSSSRSSSSRLRASTNSGPSCAIPPWRNSGRPLPELRAIMTETELMEGRTMADDYKLSSRVLGDAGPAALMAGWIILLACSPAAHAQSWSIKDGRNTGMVLPSESRKLPDGGTYLTGGSRVHVATEDATYPVTGCSMDCRWTCKIAASGSEGACVTFCAGVDDTAQLPAYEVGHRADLRLRSDGPLLAERGLLQMTRSDPNFSEVCVALCLVPETVLQVP